MSGNSGSPPIRVRFARRLKELRVPRGFPTARSFALALGIDENRYTRYERAEVEPDLSLIARICGLLGITPNDLLEVPAETVGGFAEPSGASPAASAGEIGKAAGSPRRALAWQLAVELERLNGAAESGDLDKLARTSRLFSDIDADPYAFVVQMSGDPRITSLDATTSARVGAAAGQLMAAINADVLGGKAGD